MMFKCYLAFYTWDQLGIDVHIQLDSGDYAHRPLCIPAWGESIVGI